MNSNGIKLMKKADTFPQKIRCQKCLERGHWGYQCTNKRKYLHRASRTSQLKKALQQQKDDNIQVQDIYKETKKNHVRKKMRKEESSSSSDSSSSSEESSSKSSSSSSSSDSESDSSDSVSSNSSSSSSSSTSTSNSSSSSNNSYKNSTD